MKISGSKKFRANICINGKRKCLGCFSVEKEAAKFYDKAAIESFGEFAKTNEMIFGDLNE